MTQNKKSFLIKFFTAFGIAVAVCLFIVFVLMRGMFSNAFIAKGDKCFAATDYVQAIKHYNTAKKWKKKNLNAYLCLAKAYAASEDYETAGKLIDEAIAKKITAKDTGIEQLHLMRIKVFSAEGKLENAINYIDSMSDQYMLKKIQDARPASIDYSPTQGSYDHSLKMTITVREGETVYYTTDGSSPTKFSNTYSAPINIGNGKTKITAIAVDSEGIVSPMLSVTYEVSNANEPVVFDDEKIEKMVRKELSKPRGVVLVKELESITKLDNTDVDGFIRTLSDLDLMPNLEELTLYNEKNLVSISQLSGKAKLKNLCLAQCNLESDDINALGSLAALEYLDLSHNSITSISALSELTALKVVYLESNMVSDLTPLTSSKDIEMISASNNVITAIPDLESANALSSLVLSNNRINDLSTIHRFTALTSLDLSGNLIRSAKNLAALTNLETLVISDNELTNFDFLKDLTRLTLLEVRSTGFSELSPLAGLPITTLDANDTELESLSGIEEFKNLTYLAVADTDVKDISGITGLEKLAYLDISNLTLNDPAPLFSMKNLSMLIAKGHNYKGIAFANPDITIMY